MENGFHFHKVLKLGRFTVKNRTVGKLSFLLKTIGIYS